MSDYWITEDINDKTTKFKLGDRVKRNLTYWDNGTVKIDKLVHGIVVRVYSIQWKNTNLKGDKEVYDVVWDICLRKNLWETAKCHRPKDLEYE